MALPIRNVTRPAALRGKPNGKLSTRDLVTTPGQAGGAPVRLVAPAARAWAAFTAALLAEGHTLKIGWPNSAYRPYADQERIFRDRYLPSIFGTRRWMGQRWKKRPNVAAAAVPGTSNHGWGLAVDVGEESDGDAGTESLDAGTLAAMKVHAHRFGWSWELQSEPWHIRYWAGDDIPKAVLDFEAGNDEEDDGMITLVDTTENAGWVCVAGKARKLSNLESWLADWRGTVHRDDNMRYIVADLYTVVN